MMEENWKMPDCVINCRSVPGGSMLQILICDDDTRFLSAFRMEARRILDKYDIDAAIYTFEGAEKVPIHLWSLTDIFFLDVDFSKRPYNGVDIARKIREQNTEAVIIFVTNYIEYAPEGYEVQAFRYVLKERYNDKLEPCILQGIAKLQSLRETLQVNIEGEPITIPLADILYIESQKHIAEIHVLKQGSHTEKTYRFYKSLVSLEEELSQKGFLRIQKSYIVNMRRIQKLRCNEVRLDNGLILPVSERNYSEQKKKYLLWKRSV